MNNSPCAKLTTSMMPKIRVRPEAKSARIMPLTMPFSVWIAHCARSTLISDAEILADQRIVDAQVAGTRVMADDALFEDVGAFGHGQGQRHVLLDQQHRHPVAA